jgi:DNA-binding MarR family transcriptional regulator
MMRDDLVERSTERPDPEFDDERRRYYRVTAFGRAVLTAEAERISELAHLLRERDLVTR